MAGVAAGVMALAAVDAHASVSIQVTWDGLLHDSTAAVVATTVETRSVWENGRIYTYSREHVDRAIAGELSSGADVWVRTLGGVVGKIGQMVEGEAVLSPGEAGLLFLHPGPVGAFVVTARGQGQFPVVPTVSPSDPKAPPHLVRSSAAGAMVPPATPTASPFAADVIHGRVVDDVARDITTAWDHAHTPPHGP